MVRQRELFDPEGPDRVLGDGSREELLTLLVRLLREAATARPSKGTAGADEPDHS